MLLLGPLRRDCGACRRQRGGQPAGQGDSGTHGSSLGHDCGEARGAIDFDDLVVRACELLEADLRLRL